MDIILGIKSGVLFIDLRNQRVRISDHVPSIDLRDVTVKSLIGVYGN
jgi:hypothetical protein